ncbi:amidohydrolase family protein [Candidatus Parcubacteria bacterium]|nr:amidohydrolase family protein [Candidatus Parcubacteria bacterium]
MMASIILPGLIDPHVHLRDPGQIHKEDFFTGTSAALAGGYTTVVDMPNNAEPIFSEKKLDEKISIARQKAVCDIGFNFGTLGDNFDQFSNVYDKVAGLKVYLNITTGGFIIDKKKLAEIYQAWESDKPIFLHAEDDVSDLVLSTLRSIPRRTHICHVSSQAELEFVMKAKDEGLPITCGVTPHHLFLNETEGDKLGAFGHMKPLLKPEKDRQFLWDHLDGFDIVESDHAPHTKQEKQSDNPPFGVPGLETTLPLILTAEAEGKLTRSQLLAKLHTNPAKLLGLQTDQTTKIEVDMSEYEINNEDLKAKCGWSPFAGRRVIGKVKKVILRGSTVYKNGSLAAEAGSGRIIQ